MSYEGDFNGFSFGNGVRPGASVSSLAGWRAQRADVPIVEGLNLAASGPARRLAGDVRLGLNLHATTDEELDDLIDTVTAAFTPTSIPIPLTIDGWSKWVQVIDSDPTLNPSWPGKERTTDFAAGLKAPDPTLYKATQDTQTFGSPVSTASFEAANSGRLVVNAPRAVEVRLVASGTTTNPQIRFDHADGTFEQITFQGLTMTGGQVLTIGSDNQPRVNGVISGGYTRCLTETGVTSKAPKWWLLHKSTGSDGANEVTVSVSSGAFTGWVKTRGTK